MCQLLGAIFATLGIYRAIPLVHGSQGCVNYVKHLLTQHFREPVDIATTGFHEMTTIHGGVDNLTRAIENVAHRKQPDLIAVITTCLSETIGENIYAALKKIKKIEAVAINTPSYIGTHVIGYDNAIKSIVTALGRQGERTDRINIITGIVNPGDVREIKHICREMGVDYTLLTDITSLDRPLRLPKEKFPKCETSVDDIRDAPNSRATISFGIEGISGAEYLTNFGVESYNLRFPIGIRYTENFITTLSEISDEDIPDTIWDERDYVIDAMVDANSVLRNKKVAIFGDPDKVIALTDFAFETGLRVTAVLTPLKTRHFVAEIERIAAENEARIAVFEEADLYQLHKFIKSNPVDLLIGDYRGRYIANEEGIPLLRVGFPVADRYGYHRKPMLGFRGALRIVDDIANLMVERR